MISTQRFRLPVRRYILELFDVPLDASVVRTLTNYSKALADTGATVSPNKKRPRLQPRVSVFGRPTRGQHAVESDDEDESMDSEEEEAAQAKKAAATERPVSLMPAKRISGFDGVEQDEMGRKKDTGENEVNEDEMAARERESEARMTQLLARGRSRSGSVWKYAKRPAVESDEDEL